MRNGVLKQCPFHSDCFANLNGFCVALDNVEFKGRDCPFYKTTEQNELEKDAVTAKLKSQGRDDLISKYYKKGKENGNKQI